MKIRPNAFVRNLIGDVYWDFYDDDVITVTSLVLRTQSVSAVFCPAGLFHNWPSVESYEKSEQVQRANVFKRQSQTLTFHFSTYRPNSFKHLSHHTPVKPYGAVA